MTCNWFLVTLLAYGRVAIPTPGWYQCPHFAVTHYASLAAGLKIPGTDYTGSKIIYTNVIPETSKKMFRMYFSREAEVTSIGIGWNKIFASR